jgi:hypothetical protein
MEGLRWLVPAMVLALAYVLHPLVSENLDAPWDQLELLGSSGSTDDDGEQSRQSARASQPSARPEGRRAMTDGGRVCHCCGAVVDGDYTYCGECLTPRV